MERREGQPVAWMRRYFYEGAEPPPKYKNEQGRWVNPAVVKFHNVTTVKVSDDDDKNIEKKLVQRGWIVENGKHYCCEEHVQC